MRRTRLVAAAFAGSVCLATLAPVAVASGPSAEVSPRRVRPGGTVTLTVICPRHDNRARHITAYSQAFEDGEAVLKLLSRAGGYGKPTYRGTARISSRLHGTGTRTGSDGSEWYGSGGSRSGPSQDTSGTYGGEDSAEDTRNDTGSGADDSYGSKSPSGSEKDYGSDPADPSDSPFGSESVYGSDGDHGSSYGRPSGHGKRYGINGSCPDGSDFTTSVVVERKPRGGAHAGRGGSQDGVDVAVVAAGGALLTVTVGFGVHALRRRRSEA